MKSHLNSPTERPFQGENSCASPHPCIRGAAVSIGDVAGVWQCAAMVRPEDGPSGCTRALTKGFLTVPNIPEGIVGSLPLGTLGKAENG